MSEFTVEANCIKKPISQIFEASELLSGAVEAHLNGNTAGAEKLFREADLKEVWNWTNPEWVQVWLNVRFPKRDGDTQAVPKADRDPVRDVRRSSKAANVRAAVLARDGYRCRYCGIPVVDPGIWRIAHQLYPSAVSWHAQKPTLQHAAFQCLWLQYDHVIPHSHGGSSSVDNVVISCALCNFGKWDFTLSQLGISDPRLRVPEPSSWDGLERLRSCEPLTSVQSKTARIKLESGQTAAAGKITSLAQSSAFFLPGAWVQGEYVYTPPIVGKARWFKIDANLIAEAVMRDGINGCRLVCNPAVFRRRGLSAEEFLDSDQTQ